jgi:pSer/pThr/pTyr-binding forkhead associated (FHA) protein
MSIQLVVIAGPDRGRTFTLDPGAGLMLGRAAQAHYSLSDPHTCRNHCQILLVGNQVTVICNGGAATTLVNGQRVKQHTLQPGDILEVGMSQLRLA